MTGGIVRSKAYVQMSHYLDQTNGKCQTKSVLILAVYDDQLKQRSYIGETKYILIPLSRKLSYKVQNMHAWFSFLLSVPSVQD